MNRILWADDEVALLKPYLIFLEEKGYQVTAVPSGADAIEQVAKERFDIVFLDEQMPGLSGLETLEEVKKLRPEVPIVMITKSEEEKLMEQAIGQHIADYLVKPVNPTQILMCLKKHIHLHQIVEEETNRNYREEFMEIGRKIDAASAFEEWVEVEKTLTRWELQLHEADSSMKEMLGQQRKDADKLFAKYIQKHYEDWFDGDKENRPMMSPDLFKQVIFPTLDKGEKVFMIVIDNFRYDQWKTIQPLLSEYFEMESEQLYSSILPTSTQYARNAIFSGLMPAQIEEMWPDLWVDEESDEGKNLNEKDLIQTQISRFRRHDEFTYYKINESDFCEKITKQLKGLRTPLNIAVINFIDMLSHSRTDSKMMRELCRDEAAYRSLTLSWFRHSPMLAFFRRISELGYKLILTTDHGTIHVDNAVQIIGDKSTNSNIRYKVGKALNFQNKNCFQLAHPEKVGLPRPQLSASYVFCTGNDFFAYPNNYNYYAQFYKDTFQHGGISMEEMLIPLVTMRPKVK